MTGISVVAAASRYIISSFEGTIHELPEKYIDFMR